MKRFTAACAVLMFASVPAALAAQVNGRMAAGREFGHSGDDPLLSEPRPVNMVSVLLQHRRELSLTDTQFVKLVALRRQLDSLNFPLERRLDSLLRVDRQASSGFHRMPADTVRAMRDLAHSTLSALAANMRPATDRAHTLLTERQIQLASPFEDQARALAEERARDAANPRRGLFPFAKPPG
jgi:hypothetical protein